jgi:Cell division protein FtsI/penicillin-binding protein 2
MTAQLANGGYKINPHIISDENISFEDIKSKIQKDIESLKLSSKEDQRDTYSPIRLYKNSKNIKFILEAMFASTNEPGGTSFRSRHDNKKYQFAGKTGTSQVRRITEAERELDLKQSQILYKNRDHALYIAFAPYKDPRYAISVLVEHGGSGGKTAAPLASKLIKKIIDRHELREQIRKRIANLA